MDVTNERIVMITKTNLEEFERKAINEFKQNSKQEHMNILMNEYEIEVAKSEIKNIVFEIAEYIYPGILMNVDVSVFRQEAKMIRNVFIDVINVKVTLDENVHIMAELLDELKGNLDGMSIRGRLMDSTKISKIVNRANLKIKVEVVSE